MATFIRYGCASAIAAPSVMPTNARSTDRQYGRRYAIRRRINRASYALPRMSSSCGVDTLYTWLRSGQFLLEELFLVELRVEPGVPNQLVVGPAFDDAPVV